MVRPYILLTSLAVTLASAQNPDQHWLKYKTPEQAGWSSGQLTAICSNSNANAVLLVHRGKIVFAYGEYWRRLKCHSLRKSFLSALYGIYVERGKVDTGMTIAQMAIPSRPPLTEYEKTARVADLLTCRSGVYLPSGQETEEMIRSRPDRGSHPPGTYWYYNNWDFNVLGTIFKNSTGRDIFMAFQSDIAEPLQMEDFRLIDGVYDVEPTDTSHPGYMFKMSARDAARFGQLFLQNGRWDGAQIVPSGWIAKSRTAHAATSTAGTSYGYLWWIVEDFQGVKMYYAAGYGGQRICVVPSMDLVIVTNSDTYSGNSVFDVDYVLHDIVFTSRSGERASHPEFVLLEEPIPFSPAHFDKAEQSRYVGEHTIDGISVSISRCGDALILSKYHFSYEFRLLPRSQNLFYVEDIDLLLYVDHDRSGFPCNLEIHKSEATRDLYCMIVERGIDFALKELPLFGRRLRKKEELEFLTGQLTGKGIPVLPLRELNASCFPYSYKAQSDLKDELLKTGDVNSAARVFRQLFDSVQKRKLSKTKTEWFATILGALASDSLLTETETAQLTGDYGHRRIVQAPGVLYYQTTGSVTKRQLHRISERTYAMEGTYNMYIEFGQDETGAVNRIIGHYYRDSSDEAFRTK